MHGVDTKSVIRVRKHSEKLDGLLLVRVMVRLITIKKIPKNPKIPARISGGHGEELARGQYIDISTILSC